MKSPLLVVGLFFLLLLVSLMLWPHIDLTVSRLFYTPGQGFLLADQPFLLWLHNVAYFGARFLGFVLAVGLITSFLQRRPFLKMPFKGWLFLLLALMIGPGVIANVLLKDHWGRARPHEVSQFGGKALFSEALMPQQNGHKNASFVAGDAAFGFYLSSFAYVVPLKTGRRKRHLSRRFFWGGLTTGIVFGAARIVMGGHFFSDVLFAAFFMVATSALLYRAMYGKKATAIYWHDWFFENK